MELAVKKDGWKCVQKARESSRIKAQDVIEALFSEFMPLKGDRLSKEDPAILAGLAFFEGMPVTILAQSKGKSLPESQKKHFGMPLPQGYRKAMRLAKQAEKFHRPVITIVDTPGAYPGKEAEMHGQAQAISQCLSLFSSLKTPVICIVLSEGGSGGALALSVADKIFMLENAVYSILSPEGFASILYKDESLAQKAARDMKLTAQDLLDFHIIDGIIEEPEVLRKENIEEITSSLRNILRSALKEKMKLSSHKLVQERRIKISKLGRAPWLH